MHEDFVAIVYPQVHESLKLTAKEHVHIENPLSLSETLSSMKNLDDAFTFGDQFLNDKPSDEPGKANVETEVKSMVTVPIHQASSSISPLSTPIINLTPPKPISPSVQEPIITTTTTTTTILPPPQQRTTDHDLATQAVHNAFQAPIRERFRDLSEFEMKEIIHDRMFESGSYRSHLEHTALYDALKLSMDHENKKEFNEATAKSRKRRRDGQDPPPKDSDQSKKKRHDSDASASKQPPADALAKTYKDPEEYKLLRKTRDMGSFIKWYCKQIRKSKLVKADLEGDRVRRNALSISKLKAAYYPDFRLEELAPSQWIESKRDYDISAAYSISHWWFKRKEFYITRHSAPSNRSAVRSHMRILSVFSLKTFSRYGYTFLKEIVLRRADYKEYKISEAVFKNLHPNAFEDLYLLHLQGKLNHLSGADKVQLFNAVNLWIRNIVIRQRMEDLQLEDYIIIHKPRAVIYRDRNNQKKMTRETKVHKFSDGTLTRILEKLDFMVKDFDLFKFNPDMEHRLWSKDDKQRSQEFIKLIERRLKIRRILRVSKALLVEG
ncbi:hypothetical protein Tco_0456623 [Tanacetum coccineum]